VVETAALECHSMTALEAKIYYIFSDFSGKMIFHPTFKTQLNNSTQKLTAEFYDTKKRTKIIS
jgi:hypothetical protein